MKRKIVCLIAEGSYPYVVGGVSSWIHQLIKGHPEKDFKLLSIMPSKNEKIELKYEFPENLIEVKTTYLADVYEGDIKKSVFMKYTDKEKEMINDFLDMKMTDDTKEAMKILSDKSRSYVFDFTLSEFFWEKICKKYNKEYSDKEFNSFYWSYKSIFTYVINVLQNEIPEADLYHSVSTGYAGVVGVLANIKYNKPFYLTEHGIYAREREEDILRSTWLKAEFKKIWIDYFYFLSKIAYKHNDRIVSLFDYNRELQISLGASEEKAIVIPNGINVEKFKGLEKKESKEFIIGSILRIVSIKDVKTMIRAFKIVESKIENSKLLLIGPYDEDKKYYEECKELIKDFDIEDKVTLTGRVDVKEYIKAFDIYLLSSISEGQPLSILEAMSAKIPIISTDVGDCKNILTSHKDIGEAGIIVPPTSYTVMAEKIMELYEDQEKRLTLGENGYEIANTRYREDQFLEKYLNLYNEGWY